MSIIVYHIDQNGQPNAESFSSDELGLALALCEKLRRAGGRHISISSESGDSIGKPGVDTVADGKTPDGVDYDWKKRRP